MTPQEQDGRFIIMFFLCFWGFFVLESLAITGFLWVEVVPFGLWSRKCHQSLRRHRDVEKVREISLLSEDPFDGKKKVYLQSLFM